MDRKIRKPTVFVDRPDNEQPVFVVEGIEEVIKRDLGKHKAILERTQTELLSFRQARSHEVKRKKYYNSLIGGGKFNDEALKKSIEQININIRHFSDKCTAAEEKIKFEGNIVYTLSRQLEDQEEALRNLAKHRRLNGASN